MHKDNESTFYIAKVEGENITIPSELQILEISAREPKGEKTAAGALEDLPSELVGEENPNGLDLLIRLQFDQELDKEKLSAIYEKISNAIDSAIRTID